MPATTAQNAIAVVGIDIGKNSFHIGSLRRHKLHRWTLHCFGDRFGISEVVLLRSARSAGATSSLGIGPHVLCRHQPGIVAKGIELPT